MKAKGDYSSWSLFKCALLVLLLINISAFARASSIRGREHMIQEVAASNKEQGEKVVVPLLLKNCTVSGQSCQPGDDDSCCSGDCFGFFFAYFCA